MTTITPLTDHPSIGERRAGIGLMTSERGWLPLTDLDVAATVTDLNASVIVRQSFHNPFDDAIEAVYVHPLPDRAAVIGLTVTIGDRTITGVLKERGEARADYDQALVDGHRAAITEEDRPDVFTTRVGNLLPGDRADVELRLVQPLAVEDGQVGFRFPLVVAPRYVPGAPLDGPSAGDGTVADTTAVPDASRISPPVILPGLPNPVRLALRVDFPMERPAGLAASLHSVVDGGSAVQLHPGERIDRDFILRWSLVDDADPSAGDDPLVPAVTMTPDPGAGRSPTDALASDPVSSDPVAPDAVASEAAGPAPGDGTFTLRLLPPVDVAATEQRRDVVIVLDRSGSMAGWKMVAARRAAARIIDTLTSGDRFTILAFDGVIDRPVIEPPTPIEPSAPAPVAGPGVDVPGGEPVSGLFEASDRNRWLAIEWLAKVEARGGTELRAPLTEACRLLGASDDERRRPTCVVITDGQVGNEDQILAELMPAVGAARIFTVGIDRAVNAGFLQRLAAVGGGRCELVESEDRLDQVMTAIHRRISDVSITGVTIEAVEGAIDGLSPAGPVDCFAGVPLVIRGRYQGRPPRLRCRGTLAGDERWEAEVPPPPTVDDPAARALWGRARIRDLEDAYASTAGMAADRSELADRIVALSLATSVLSRFTALVAVDVTERVDSTAPRPVVQPVEVPSGWQAGPTAARSMQFGAGQLTAPPSPMPAPGSAPPGPAMVAGAPVPADLVARSSKRRRFGRGRSTPAAPPPPPPTGPTPAVVPVVLDRYLDRLTSLLDRLEATPDDRRARQDLDELRRDLLSVGGPADLCSLLADLVDRLGSGRPIADVVAAIRRELADADAGAGRPGSSRPFWR